MKASVYATSMASLIIVILSVFLLFEINILSIIALIMIVLLYFPIAIVLIREHNSGPLMHLDLLYFNPAVVVGFLLLAISFYYSVEALQAYWHSRYINPVYNYNRNLICYMVQFLFFKMVSHPSMYGV